jgi:hypothetical protein
MAPNIRALRAYSARLMNAIPPKKVCDGCDAVMSGSPSTYLSHRVRMLVTPAPASAHPQHLGDEGECEAGVCGDLEEREAMALEGGTSPPLPECSRPCKLRDRRAWANLVGTRPSTMLVCFWIPGAVRPSSSDGVLATSSARTSPRGVGLGSAQVIGLLAASARLSDGRTFVPSLKRAPQ